MTALDELATDTETATARPRRPGVRSVASLAVLGGFFSVAHGQDINYDQFNNHVWAVWALLHPHVSLQAGVGGPSGFLPSVWNVPWYLAQQHLPAVVVGFLLGTVHGVAVWFAWALAWEVSTERSARVRAASAGLAGAFAFFAPSVQTEFGTTFGNLTTAIPVMAALLLLVRSGPTLTSRRAFVVALLAGAAVGAKLSNAVFVLALAAAAPFAVRQLSRPLASAAAALGGLVAGFLVTDGWWAYRLWTDLRSPTFPFLNQVFGSPYGPDSYVKDPRFSTGGPLGILTLPFKTATLGGYPSEIAGRDVRWVVLIALAAVFLAVAARRRAGEPRRAFRAVAAFVVVGYLAWAVVFGIGRYLAPVELASGAILLGLVEPLLRSPLRRTVGLAGATVVTALLLVAPDFGHFAWRAHWYPVTAEQLGIPHDAVVVFPTNDSASWVLTALPGDVQPYQVPRVFSAQPWAPVPAPPRLDDEIAAVLRTTDRPVYAVSKTSSVSAASSTAGLYGRHVAPDGCRTVRALVPLSVCRWDRG